MAIWFEIHKNEQVTMRQNEINDIVMTKERGQNTHSQGERGENTPLTKQCKCGFPSNGPQNG